MRIALLLFIKTYWLVKPKRWNGRCLYRVSCSRAVYDVTNRDGLFSGLNLLWSRFQNCRSGYYFTIQDNKWMLHTVGGKIIEESNVALHLIKEIRNE